MEGPGKAKRKTSGQGERPLNKGEGGEEGRRREERYRVERGWLRWSYGVPRVATFRLATHDFLAFLSHVLFAPLLEESHALAPAVGPPEVAAAGGVVAAIVGAVVAGPHAPDAGTPKKVDIRRASEQKIRRVLLCSVMMEVVGSREHED